MNGEITGATELLPPFPDDLVLGRDPEKVLQWLRQQRVPPILSGNHFDRWARYTGVAVTEGQRAAARWDYFKRTGQ